MSKTLKILLLHSERSNYQQAIDFLTTLDIDLVTSVYENEGFQTGGYDLIISYLYPRKISMKLINSAKIGSINFHPAILPENRGYRTYPFAILEERSKYGVTCHLMEESFDTGDIISILKFSIDHKKETCLSLKKKAHSYLLLLFKTIVSYVVKYNKLPTATKQGKGKSCNRNKLEYLKFVDLRKITAEELKKHIRAFWHPPYHTAKIMVDGEEFSLISEETLKALSLISSDNNMLSELTSPKEQKLNWVYAKDRPGIIINPTKEEEST